MRWRKGFTMIELSIVVVIVIMLAATVIPQYLSTISDTRVEQAAQQVGRAMRFARQMAVTLRTNITLATAPGWNKVCVVNPANGDTLYRFGLAGGASVISVNGTPTFFARGTSLGATIVVGDSDASKDVIVNVVSRVRIDDHIG